MERSEPAHILPVSSLHPFTFSFVLYINPPQRVSPSAEMVMIDRMFIQEEKTTLALDKQLAKEKPGERGGEGEASPTYLVLRFPASNLMWWCTGKAEAQ